MSEPSSWTWPRWIAHRGGGSSAPENTLGGVRLAAALGFRAVEIDVRLSADGLPMVIHDDTLQRTTGQPGEVHRMPAGKLARTRASVGFEGTEFANETIPELGPLLIVAAHAGLCVNVELKPGPEGPEALAAAVMRTVTAIEWALPLRRLLLSSFDAQALAAIRAARPESGRALLVEHSDSQSIATALELGCISVNVGEAACTTETMVAASQAGLHTCVWTVNRLETASILFRQGAAAVFTDQLAFLNQPGVESL